ncbi:MAG: hypothetical protein R3D01_11970 [Hyphomicrobiales bacterium]
MFDFDSIKESPREGHRNAIRFLISSWHRPHRLADHRRKKGSGNQAFKWIGKHGFHDRKGELHYVTRAMAALSGAM